MQVPRRVGGIARCSLGPEVVSADAATFGIVTTFGIVDIDIADVAPHAPVAYADPLH